GDFLGAHSHLMALHYHRDSHTCAFQNRGAKGAVWIDLDDFRLPQWPIPLQRVEAAGKSTARSIDAFQVDLKNLFDPHLAFRGRIDVDHGRRAGSTHFLDNEVCSMEVEVL